MLDVDARVDNVRTRTISRALVVAVRRRPGLGARQPRKAPGRVPLRCADGDDGVLLDRVDVRVVPQRGDLGGVEGRREAAPGAAEAVDVVGVGGKGGHGGPHCARAGVVPEPDDVLVRDEGTAARLDERRGLGASRGGGDSGEGEESEERCGVHRVCGPVRKVRD